MAAHVKGNGFINYRAVALRSAKAVAQQVGRIPHIIEQPDLAKIIVACKMKSEKIIVQCVRDQFDKFNLTFHREPNAVVFDLLARHTGLHHQGRHVDARRHGVCTGESRERAGGAWAHAYLLKSRITHETWHPTSPSDLLAASARRWRQFSDLPVSHGPLRTAVLEAILIANKGDRYPKVSSNCP